MAGGVFFRSPYTGEPPKREPWDAATGEFEGRRCGEVSGPFGREENSHGREASEPHSVSIWCV